MQRLIPAHVTTDNPVSAVLVLNIVRERVKVGVGWGFSCVCCRERERERKRGERLFHEEARASIRHEINRNTHFNVQQSPKGISLSEQTQRGDNLRAQNRKL